MTKIISLPLFLVLLLSCTPFPTVFERIEPDKLRVLNAVFFPSSDAAPGDTVAVRLYLAGDSVSTVTDWKVSYDIIINEYGEDSALDYHTIVQIEYEDGLPDSVSVRFVIPDSVFYTTRAISNQALDIVRGLLPEGMRNSSRNELVDFSRDIAATDFNDATQLGLLWLRWGEALGIAGITNQDSLNAAIAGLVPGIGALMSVFSINSYLTCTARTAAGTELPVLCRFSIRYNRKLADSPVGFLAPVNHNPVIRWIGIADVAKDSVFFFDPADPCTTYYLFNESDPSAVSDTVLISAGHSYFLVADSGISPIPLTLSGPFMTPRVVNDTATLRISFPQGTVNLPLVPGDTLRDPFLVPRNLNALFYRRQFVMPLGLQAQDSAIWGDDGQLFIDTSSDDTTAPAHPDRASASMSIVTRDFGLTLEQTVDVENYSFQWWFQNLDPSPLSQDSLIMAINPNGNPGAFLPPVDTDMHRFRIWVSIRDSFLGEINRPYCLTNKSVTGYFKYSQAYIDRHKK